MRTARTSSVLILLLFLSAPARFHRAGADSITGWRVLGPGGGGTMLRPVISPHDPNIAIITCDMTGSYITYNGGRTWRIFNLGGRVDAVAFDPIDPNVIYAGTVGLYRSQDRGFTWALLWPQPGKVIREEMDGDHAGRSYVTEDNYPGGSITMIRIDPEDSNKIYVGFGGVPRVYFSDDRGVSWRFLKVFPGTKIHNLFIDPKSPQTNRTLYAFTDRGLFVRESGNWEGLGGIFPRGWIEHVAGGFRKSTGEPLFVIVTPLGDTNAALFGGVYRSVDGGRTWMQANRGFTRIIDRNGRLILPKVRYVACSDGNPDIFYIKVGDEYPYGKAHILPGREFISTVSWDRPSGIYKSTDGGATWSPVQSWSWNLEPSGIDSGWINARFGTEYMELGHLGVAPTDPDTCYSSDLYRAYKTTDGGRTWRQVYSITFDDESVTTRGLDVTTCYGVHFDPFDKKKVFITYTDIGLFRSDNNGRSWQSALDGVPHAWWNTCYWLEFDPAVPGKLWTVWSNVHDLPRHKMYSHRDTDWWRGGICMSTDGGRTWRKLEPGLPDDTAYTHLLLDPTSPEEARTLYACGFRKGVYKSTDGGKTWLLRNRGLGSNLNAWRITRTGTGKLYLTVFRDYRGNREKPGAVYRSRDGGESWWPVTLPGDVTGPADIAVHPRCEEIIYLAAWGPGESGAKCEGGVYRSVDAGRTWRRILDKAQYIYSVTVDPKQPGRIYAVSFESAAYASEDGGESWKRIRGFNFKWGHRAIPDPYDDSMIYITTFGGSLWHGPWRGVPDSVIEDVISWRVVQ